MSEFGGRTISGDITRYSEQKEQHDPQLFLDALDTLLAVPGVEAVRWNQYTPYFNDGEVCTFRIYGAMVKIAGDEDDEAGDYGDGYRDEYNLYDYEKGDTPLDYGSWKKVYRPIGGHDTKVIAEALEAFDSVLDSGRHYVVLNEKFGDPAQVTATREGFAVEFYDHD